MRGSGGNARLRREGDVGGDLEEAADSRGFHVANVPPIDA